MQNEIKQLRERLIEVDERYNKTVCDLYREIESLKEMLAGKVDKPATSPATRSLGGTMHRLVSDVPHSAKSSEGLDLEAIVQQIPAPEDRAPMFSHLIGMNSLFTRYLSPMVIVGGRGFIKPNDNFRQYEEDISNISFVRLSTWPSGFYRNATTKEMQLLIKTNEMLICLDDLPGNAGRLHVIYLPAVADIAAKDVDLMDYKELAQVHDALQMALSTITQENF